MKFQELTRRLERVLSLGPGESQMKALIHLYDEVQFDGFIDRITLPDTIKWTDIDVVVNKPISMKDFNPLDEPAPLEVKKLSSFTSEIQMRLLHKGLTHNVREVIPDYFEPESIAFAISHAGEKFVRYVGEELANSTRQSASRSRQDRG